jgi:glycosyltransferase involved in cell wall biosynthesis
MARGPRHVHERIPLRKVHSMASRKLPRVSVCLLTYKRASVLPQTIDSLLAQSHSDFELIINDNHSPDNTEEVCREYERRDPRVRYFKNPVNVFYAGNQNAALLRSTADYVALVHDGDVYRPDLLEKWTSVLEAEPSAALVFNGLDQMDASGKVVRSFRHPYKQLTPGLQLFDEMIRRPDSPIFGIAMVRRRCVMATGPFDPRIPTLADVDMWLRLLLHYDAAYIPEPLICVASREAGHVATRPNWNVRREHELIYLLNTARRYPGQPEKVARLRREIAPMLWKCRARMFLQAVRHGDWRAASHGLRFAARVRSILAEPCPDNVLDWAGFQERLGSLSKESVRHAEN